MLASERRIGLYHEGQDHIESFIRLHHPADAAGPSSVTTADICDEFLPVQRAAAVSFHINAGAVSFVLGFTVSMRCLQVDPDERSVWGNKGETCLSDRYSLICSTCHLNNRTQIKGLIRNAVTKNSELCGCRGNSILTGTCTGVSASVFLADGGERQCAVLVQVPFNISL